MKWILEGYSVSVSVNWEKQLVAVAVDASIELWSIKSNTKLHTLMGHTDLVTSLKISKDRNTLVSGSDDQTVLIWDIKFGLSIGELLISHEEGVTSIAISNDGKTIVLGSDNYTVYRERIEHR